MKESREQCIERLATRQPQESLKPNEACLSEIIAEGASQLSAASFCYPDEHDQVWRVAMVLHQELGFWLQLEEKNQEEPAQ